jgi:hypothetical protein
MGYAAAIDRARARVAAKAHKFLPDVLTVYTPGAETRDGAGWETSEDKTFEVNGSEASEIPCSYSALSAFERSAGGTVTQSASHRLRMPINEFTLAIQPRHRLIVAERGEAPELTFEVTGRLDSSTSLFLEVAATLRS